MHRLRLGLPGYLILFAPLAFVPQCQELSRDSPSPLVFHLISTHFTATPSIPVPPPTLEQSSFQCHFRVELRDFTSDLPATYAPFTPSESEQRLGPLYYRGCWHRVSRPFLFRYYQVFIF